MRNTRVLGFLLATVLAFTSPALMAADAVTGKLTTCVVDSTTGKDRKELARWIFVTMAAHPDIKGVSSVTAVQREASDRNMADLVTRLMTVSCAQETKLALDQVGARGLEASFEVLGKLAMKELMSNPDVALATEQFLQFLDKEKFQRALELAK